MCSTTDRLLIRTAYTPLTSLSNQQMIHCHAADQWCLIWNRTAFIWISGSGCLGPIDRGAEEEDGRHGSTRDDIRNSPDTVGENPIAVGV